MAQIPYYRWRPHPWHGLGIGPNPPQLVHAYIEITPFDLVKYEVDKETGYLRIDRPQRTSSQPPVLYGFVPRTYCGGRVGALFEAGAHGDGDPLDICVISERPVDKSEVLLNAVVVGGLRMIDNGDVDDKIVGVLQNDNFWGGVEDISGLPRALVERMRHYFSTYKMLPGEAPHVYIQKVYGKEEAIRVVEAAILDYQDAYGSQSQSGGF